MRNSFLFGFAAAAFFAQAQAQASPKGVASFFHAPGGCDGADLGAEMTLYQSGNATANANTGPFYSIAMAQVDPGCTVEWVLDWDHIKWNDNRQNQKRNGGESVGSLADADADVKNVRILTWGQQTSTVSVHPVARRQGGGVVTKVCQSAAWGDEGMIAFKGLKVSGC